MAEEAEEAEEEGEVASLLPNHRLANRLRPTMMMIKTNKIILSKSTQLFHLTIGTINHLLGDSRLSNLQPLVPGEGTEVEQHVGKEAMMVQQQEEPGQGYLGQCHHMLLRDYAISQELIIRQT